MSMVTNRWGHRTRNQAQTIIDQVELLERDLARSVEERKRPPGERLHMITQLAEAIKLKPIKEPLDREKGVRHEQANRLLRQTVAKVMAELPNIEGSRPIELGWACAAGEDDCIAVNPVWFEMIVENILENAKQFVQAETAPRLQIGTQRGGNMVEMTFADNGPGINPERKEQLTAEPVIKDPDEPGHGIGLFLARLVMETYEGKISINDNKPRGAIISLSFPCLAQAEQDDPRAG